MLDTAYNILFISSSKRFLSSITTSLIKFNSRVNYYVHQVGEQYSEYAKHSQEHIVAHDEGNITLHHSVERYITYTVKSEYLLGDDRT